VPCGSCLPGSAFPFPHVSHLNITILRNIKSCRLINTTTWLVALMANTVAVIARSIRDSIQEIDDDSWIIGDEILLSRHRSSSSHFTWNDGNSFYFVSEAPRPLPPYRPLSMSKHIHKVYDAGGVSAVWSIGGNAFCKVKILDPSATREHVTLDYLQQKRPLSFKIPDVYFHAEHNGRYYIFLSALPGKTLEVAWHNIDEDTKCLYVAQVVNACKEMALWQGDSISGVDGRYLVDTYLTRFGVPKNFSPQSLMDNCGGLGMDCCAFLFYRKLLIWVQNNDC
jgi:hypothetical protein